MSLWKHERVFEGEGKIVVDADGRIKVRPLLDSLRMFDPDFITREVEIEDKTVDLSGELIPSDLQDVPVKYKITVEVELKL